MPSCCPGLLKQVRVSLGTRRRMDLLLREPGDHLGPEQGFEP